MKRLLLIICCCFLKYGLLAQTYCFDTEEFKKGEMVYVSVPDFFDGRSKLLNAKGKECFKMIASAMKQLPSDTQLEIEIDAYDSNYHINSIRLNNMYKYLVHFQCDSRCLYTLLNDTYDLPPPFPGQKIDNTAPNNISFLVRYGMGKYIKARKRYK